MRSHMETGTLVMRSREHQQGARGLCPDWMEQRKHLESLRSRGMLGSAIRKFVGRGRVERDLNASPGGTHRTCCWVESE